MSSYVTYWDLTWVIVAMCVGEVLLHIGKDLLSLRRRQ
jgi:hypothetical protein